MNRRELIAALSERIDTDKRRAEEALQGVLDLITETVSKGEAVAISGFAKFARRDVPAKPRRMGRNPATGEEMMLAPKPASRSVKITPLKAFKDTVISGKRAPAKKAPAKKKAAAKKAAVKKKTTAKKAPARTTTRRR
jgi:DNA-binding protein HU-beta